MADIAASVLARLKNKANEILVTIIHYLKRKCNTFKKKIKIKGEKKNEI